MRGFGHRKSIKLLMLFCLAVIVASGWRIYKVNAEIPEPEKLVAEKGSEYPVADGIALSIQGKEWLMLPEIVETYGKGIGICEGFDYKAVVVEAEVHNVSQKEQRFELYQLYLESDAWYTNGVDMEMYMTNTTEGMLVVLKPGEKKTVYLPYLMSDVQFTSKEWENVESGGYYLVNQRYPLKVYWEI